jgi:hypothetical protein
LSPEARPAEAQHVDPLDVQELAELLKPDGHVAIGHQRRNGDPWGGLHEFLLHGGRDAPPLEQGEQVIAAGPGRIADARGGQDRLPDGVFRIDCRAPVAGSDRDGHRGVHDIDAAAGTHVPLRDQLVECTGRQHDGIAGFAGGHALRRVDTSHRDDRHLRAW